MPQQSSGKLVHHSPIPFVFCHPPDHPVVHIGSKEHLWDVKPWELAGKDGTLGGRFDDPSGTYSPPLPIESRFRVFYCASDLTGALCELLGHEKPSASVAQS